MKEKYKLILIIIGVIFLMGVIGRIIFIPATSTLQQQSPLEENMFLPEPEVQTSRIDTADVQPKQRVNEAESTASLSQQEVKPLVLPLDMQSYLDKHLELKTETLNADIAEQKARAWNAEQAQKLHDTMNSIGINDSPVRIERDKTPVSSVSIQSSSDIEAISVRSIVEVNGQYTARIYWKGRLKKVIPGDRLGGIRIHKITRDSVVARDSSGIYAFGVRSNQ
ncbi:hypothetical protein MACH09_45340 [Vibrio sp. MACH09]|uniref:hypothetical protein n=1 Tax=Vibrio sp. MACH09 TaxID=3025122 RepID=UPI002790C8ED|nr:hypothetical protein [Vibrio sp. MACH09]GLO64026.1 hypothetical protein MACH09_45340 [Vibrio sp. MACH09]